MCKKSIYLILLLTFGLAVSAANGQSVKINFQSATQGSREVPVGYLPDYGDLFGDRGNGFSYGWSVDKTSSSRDRDSGLSPDQRYDTLNDLVHWQTGTGIWEIALPNSSYDVYIAGGDPSYDDQTNSYLIEGVEVIDPTPYPPGNPAEDKFDEFTVTVAVDDGRLTIEPASGADPKICFVHIVDVRVALPVSPANNSILLDTSVQLQWLAGKDAIQHDVYIGEDFDAVDAATPDTAEIYKGRQSEEVYPATGPMILEPGKTYYWRIDEFDGTNIFKGGVSSFTVQVLTAFNPEPVDGGIFVDPNIVLSWSKGAGALVHFVYFGDNFDSVRDATTTSPEYKGMKTASTTTWDPPENLDLDKTYYWRIDERASDGALHKGDVWSFTTVSRAGGGLKGEYYDNTDLAGDPVLTRIDPQIDFDWGLDTPDPNITNVDAFSIRWTGQIEIPASGEWTFWTNADDVIMLWVNGQLLIDESPGIVAWYSATINLEAGFYPIMMEFHDTGNIALVRLLWQGPLVPTRHIIPAGALLPPFTAGSPNPPDNDIGVRQTPTLQWTAGDKAVQHDVYFGTDETAVDNADTTTADIYRGRQELENTEYIPAEAPLTWGQTYYWRVDEIETDGTMRKGSVWSFTVADYVIVDDFEDYNDISNKIYDVWTDYYVNNTGMTVGHLDPPFAERSIVHNGIQSMYMRYDNDGTVNEGTGYEQGGTLFYSEAERQWADAQDWTANGVQSLALWFRGIPASVGSFTIGPPITMTGAGADIWETSDQFHFAYKRLSGGGSITARVVSMTDTHDSAKAGVMIRESLEPDSAHAMVNIQPMNEVQFLRRIETGAESEVDSQSNISTPVWVKLTRSGNTFTGEYSVNGNQWETLGSVTIPMLLDTYIGLIVCSHDNNAICTAEFSDVSMSGTVTGDWQSQDIGIESNSAEQFYVVVQDSTGNSAVVNHPDPLATTFSDWTQWDIPLADFAGVNMQNITMMAIGVGDRANPQAGGSGLLYIDDIGLRFPASE